MTDLMAFLVLRSQKLGERRASARSRQGFEIIGSRNATALQRGSFARLFQSTPLKTGRFPAGFLFTDSQNLSRQIGHINRVLTLGR
jgi:hypothetical protein